MASLALLIAMAAIAVHAPGHVSMDTSIQLYEAFTGESQSWNPPFMSALLNWLGGGEVATAAIVCICAVLIYGGYAVVATVVSNGEATVSCWRVLLALAVIANPVVAIYVGIVWKDVLFSAFLCGGVAFGLSASRGSQVFRWACAVLSTALLAAAFITRQQGVFMAPVLLGIPIVSLGANSRIHRWIRWTSLPLLFIACALVFQAAAAATIRGDGGRSSSIGFRSIMIFDMMGIVAYSPKRPAELAFPILPDQWTAVRAVYTPTRIDNIALNPIAEAWVAGLNPSDLRAGWWALVKQNPTAYAHHRLSSYASLLGLHGIGSTAPVHIGVEGNSEFLKAVGMHEVRGPRDLLIYRFASTFFGWPIYFHAFWLGMLAVSCVAVARVRSALHLRQAGIFILAAVALLFISYLPTMISCDFRYLFGVIPLIGLAMLTILLGGLEGDFPATNSPVGQ